MKNEKEKKNRASLCYHPPCEYAASDAMQCSQWVRVTQGIKNPRVYGLDTPTQERATLKKMWMWEFMSIH